MDLCMQHKHTDRQTAEFIYSGSFVFFTGGVEKNTKTCIQQ